MRMEVNIKKDEEEMDEKLQALLMPVDTNIRFDSVVLSDENRQKYAQFINEQKYADKFLKYGLRPINRLLLYGDSGCGKTYSSKALSNELGYKMLYVDIGASLQQGNVSENISLVFKYANKHKRCMIFFDECDSIAWARDSKNAESGDIRRALNGLFQQLDQMDPSNIFVSCTNLLPRLDAAFERRFDMKMEFRRPECDLRELMQKFLFDDFNLVDDVDNEDANIINRRTQISYYGVQIIVERNMKKAIMANTFDVKTSDIYKDIAIQQGIKIRLNNEYIESKGA